MNILVVGSARTEPLFYAKLANLRGTRVRYCPTESEAINVLRLSPAPWAGILLETPRGQRDNIALARTLRAVHADAPILFVRHFQNEDKQSDAPRPCHCAVERTADGAYVLHCALRSSEWDAQQPDHPAREGQFDSPWMFEFSAPCKVNR